MSLHDDALDALARWDAPDETQEILRRRYVTHLRATPGAMTRECLPDHLTASTLVLSADGERVLLTLHAKARAWFQLGGHCEPQDQTLAAAALREAIEESGIAPGDLRLDPVPVQLSEHPVPFCGRVDQDSAHARSRTTHHLDVRYVAVAAPDVRAAVSEESLDLRWWPADALPDPQPDLVELVSLARARSAHV